MNERIQELACKAGMRHPVMGEIVYSSFSHEEFAELIVRKCMELTHWKDFDMSVEQRIRLSVYQDIKEHFGVK